MVSKLPPVEASNHLILYPVNTAFKSEVAPAQMVAGLAEMEVGSEGIAPTVTVAVTELVQPLVTV